jgi:hypothetical protein
MERELQDGGCGDQGINALNTIAGTKCPRSTALRDENTCSLVKKGTVDMSMSALIESKNTGVTHLDCCGALELDSTQYTSSCGEEHMT